MYPHKCCLHPRFASYPDQDMKRLKVLYKALLSYTDMCNDSVLNSKVFTLFAHFNWNVMPLCAGLFVESLYHS